MKKYHLLCTLLLIALILSACQPLAAKPPAALSLPKIDRHPAAASFGRTALSTLPTYDPTSQNFFQVDLRMYDVSALDFSQSADALAHADFDTQTKWPAAGKLPSGFDPQRILELGKNPGLGVRALHDQGIDGRGVGIAIIDQPMLVDHQEYTSQLQLYEEINIPAGMQSEMHGPAVASIAVGKSLGVAPAADLYYIATYPGDFGLPIVGGFTYNFTYIAQAIQRILDVNQSLPAGHKIRVISISVGWAPDQKGYTEVNAAVKKAREAGLLVVSTSLKETFGYDFYGMGRDALSDPADFASYRPGTFLASRYAGGQQFPNTLLVPMDARTTASPGGPQEYVYYSDGGMSWAVPYIAGMYALADQVKPDLTPDIFWSTALKTGRTTQVTQNGQTFAFGVILDPVALLAALKTP